MKNSPETPKWQMYLAGVILLIVAVFSVWIFFRANPSVQAGIITFFGAVGVAVFTHNKTQKREINARHFSEKSKAYQKIIDLVFDFVRLSKEGKEMSQDDMLTKGLDLKKALLVWGSANVIEVWNKFEMEADQKLDPQKMFNNMELVLREMRKDLGHNDSELKFGNLWGLILAPDAKREFLN